MTLIADKLLVDAYDKEKQYVIPDTSTHYRDSPISVPAVKWFMLIL